MDINLSVNQILIPFSLKDFLGNSCIWGKYLVFLGILPLPRSPLNDPEGERGREAGRGAAGS